MFQLPYLLQYWVKRLQIMHHVNAEDVHFLNVPDSVIWYTPRHKPFEPIFNLTGYWLFYFHHIVLYIRQLYESIYVYFMNMIKRLLAKGCSEVLKYARWLYI